MNPPHPPAPWRATITGRAYRPLAAGGTFTSALRTLPAARRRTLKRPVRLAGAHGAPSGVPAGLTADGAVGAAGVEPALSASSNTAAATAAAMQMGQRRMRRARVEALD